MTRTTHEGTLEKYLETYDSSKYAKPSITTDLVVFAINDEEVRNKRKNTIVNLQVLLVKRNKHPFRGEWTLPGGFIQLSEGLETSAKLKLKEKTHVEGGYMEQLYTWGDDVSRDPRMRVVSVSFLALVDKTNLIHSAETGYEDVKWFNLKICSKTLKEETNLDEGVFSQENTYQLISEDGDVTLNFVVKNNLRRHGASQIKQLIQENHMERGIGFDHGKIIDYALERLRNKIQYTPIAFNLAPSTFTLSYLQSVYEAILNKPLIASNFRRKILPMLEETNTYDTGKQKRPAKYYRPKLTWDSWE